MNNTDEKTPSPSLAASCVRLTLVNDDDEKDDDERFTFRPVYTHQLFPDEVVRGYQPFPEDDVVDDHGETRSSIRRRATHRLRASILLAPSCRSCRVRTETEEVRTTTTTTNEDANGDAETRALDDDDDDDAPPAAKRSRTVGFVDVATPDGAASPPSSAAVSARLSLDEIVAALRRALPPVVVYDDDAVDVEHDRLTAPIGEVVERYRVEGDEHEYVVSIADGGAAAAYHRAVQNLALWFVETAEPVDIDRVDNGGYWRVLYLFRASSEQPREKNNDAETTTTHYSFVGYCTLYHFRAPFRRPTPGTVARICQILVLPPFQRAGHGRRLVERAYDAARDDDDVVEINVEDPSPAFARLRDAIDAERLAAADPSDDDDDVAATERRTTELAAALGVTRTQVARAREIRRLRRLVGDDGDPTVADDARERTFRIAVKKRLLRTRAEELGAVEGGREAQKKRLGELYDELRAHYGAVLARATKR